MKVMSCKNLGVFASLQLGVKKVITKKLKAKAISRID
jgi:hypothetical protein